MTFPNRLLSNVAMLLLTTIPYWHNSTKIYARPLIHTNVSFGQRWFASKYTDEININFRGRSTLITISAPPFSSIPLNLGLSYELCNISTSHFIADIRTATYHRLNLDIQFRSKEWKGLLSYATFRHGLTSKITANSHYPEQSFRASGDGSEIQVGIKYKLVPLAFLDFGYNQSQLKFTNFHGRNNYTITTRALLIGLETII